MPRIHLLVIKVEEWYNCFSTDSQTSVALSHWHTVIRLLWYTRSFSLCLYVSVSLSLCLCLSVSVSLSLSLCLSLFVCLSISLSLLFTLFLSYAFFRFIFFCLSHYCLYVGYRGEGGRGAPFRRRHISVKFSFLTFGVSLNLYPSWVRSQRPILVHLCINWRDKG